MQWNNVWLKQHQYAKTMYYNKNSNLIKFVILILIRSYLVFLWHETFFPYFFWTSSNIFYSLYFRFQNFQPWWKYSVCCWKTWKLHIDVQWKCLSQTSCHEKRTQNILEVFEKTFWLQSSCLHKWWIFGLRKKYRKW